MSGPRTWSDTWFTEDLQYAYDRGIFEGVIVFDGLMNMAYAIQEREHIKQHCHRHGHHFIRDEGCDKCGEIYHADPTYWAREYGQTKTGTPYR